MKILVLSAELFLLMVTASVHSQGTVVYDQQSSVEGSYQEFGIGDISAVQPTGQSFTPTLPAVGFVRFHLNDGSATDSGTSLLYVSLHSGSITGPILGTSDSVVLQPRTVGPVDFFFSVPIQVVPGTTYFFQPVVQSGHRWGANAGQYNYAGGNMIVSGSPLALYDLWFREGIIVPEPSVFVLLGLGMLLFASSSRPKPYIKTKE
jgi:hypothetical protein